MAPTDDLRAKLRPLIDEIIPAGKLDTDTRIDNTELDEILTASATLNYAAAEGWRRKAARAMSERGGLEKSSAGDESHTFVSIEAYRDHCLRMAAQFGGVQVGTIERSDFWE